VTNSSPTESSSCISRNDGFMLDTALASCA
jgi:hypothetical protein